MFSEIWKRFNVTTVLVTPLMDNQTVPLIYRQTVLEYPFTLAALEHGMVNGYLGVRDEHNSIPEIDHKSLYLMFHKTQVLSELRLLNVPYYSFNELLIDSDVFHSINDKNSDYIVYKMDISPEWEDDIQRITEGKYSKLSKRYREEIRIKQNRIPHTDNPMFEYLFSSNMAHFISNRDKKLGGQIGDFLHMRLPKGAELFKKFRPETETLDLSLLIELKIET